MSERRPIGAEQESDERERYRRPRRPVEVRRRARWKTALWSAGRILLALVAVAALGGAGTVSYRFLTTAPLLGLASIEAVDVADAAHVPAEAVRERFAADVGRSVLMVPLAARRKSLEEITWVEAATVQRVLPNRLRVYIRERIPVAFLRQGQSLWLVDSEGVLLPPPERADHSFPVLSGVGEGLSPAERRARVELYLDFVGQLDREGGNHSARLSEIDLSDPEDVQASVTEADGAVWLHFGRGDYREKFEAYLEHRSLWQQSGESVRSVDLRYRGQLVLNPDPAGETGKR